MENKNQQQTPAKNKQQDPYFLVKILSLILFALLIALPVAKMARRAQNPESALTEERLKPFTDESRTVQYEQSSLDAQGLDGALGGGRGPRAEDYSNIGSAILTVNLANITRLSPQDFTKIGQTPFSLTNTVASNMKTPVVTEVVFNNRQVVLAFLSRPGVVKLAGSPKQLSDFILNESFAAEKFYNNRAVQSVLADGVMLEALLKSSLIDNLLQSASGQYFIKNPQEALRLIESNEKFKPLLTNENLKTALLNNPRTSAAAAQVFK